MYIFLFVIIAYLFGSVSFGIVSSKLFNLGDPRTYGSKNPGATNVLRSGNKSAAVLTLLGDGFKGWLAVWLAQKYGPQFNLDDSTVALVAVAVFLGHLWPLFFRFQGGKGVATFLGILIGIHFGLAAAILVIWLIVAYLSRYASLASLIACVSAPFLYAFFEGPDTLLLALVVMSALLMYRHAKNIGNLLAGKENRIGAKKNSGKTV